MIYFINPLGRAMGLPDAASTLAATKLPPTLAAELNAAALADTARRVIRSLTAWNMAEAVQELTQKIDQTDTERLSRQIADQAAWLAEGEEIPFVRDALASIPVLTAHSSVSTTATNTGVDETLYRDYATFLDLQYPADSERVHSWWTILTTSGLPGWRERLWNWPDRGKIAEQQAQSLADRYVASRLRPLIRLRLAQLASELKTWAIQRTTRDWLSIVQWKDSVRLRRGVARLCGSWQWTIHNHQNHGEQKLTVSFSPPDAPSGGGPAEIVILGDVVYLRWEGGGRVQEDSLLLSKENQRLEGTFVNNMGGWGSITGKRVAGCQMK
jgi:hypothetical protein